MNSSLIDDYHKEYSYAEILREVKDLILPTIMDNLNANDVMESGLRKQDIGEHIFSQIMGLGYNDSDISSTVNDLMPTRNQAFYPGPDLDDAASMAIQLAMITKDYFRQVLAFTSFHKMTQESKPHDEVIQSVKRILFTI